MSLLGGIGRAIMNGIPGSDYRAENDANAQEKQLQAQNAQRVQQQQDEEFAQHVLEMGARPVVNGAVKRDLTLPDGRTIPSGLLDKADSSRLINHKTADGRTVQFELPSAEEQIGTHAKRLMQQFTEGMPLVEAQGQQTATQTRRNESAKYQGEGEGKTLASTNDLATRGIKLGPGEAASYGLPEATAAVTPETAMGLSKVITPANIRGKALTDRADIQAKAKTDAAQALADQKAQQEADKLKVQADWNAARERMFGTAEAGKNARMSLTERGKSSRFNTAQNAHLKATNDLFKEQQAQLQAQALIDEDTQPGALYGTNTTQSVPDGQEFTDPWTGKKATMNGFQRRRLKSAIETSAQHAQALKQQAEGIAGEYLGGQAEPAAASPAAPAQAPANDKVRVKTGAGQVGMIPRANLKKAQQLDPKLQVLDGVQ